MSVRPRAPGQVDAPWWLRLLLAAGLVGFVSALAVGGFYVLFAFEAGVVAALS